MNLYILATFIAVTTAAQLPSRSYIPQGQGSQPSGLGGSSSFQGSSGFHSGSSGYQGGSNGFSGGSNGFGGSGGFSGGNPGLGGGSGNTRPQQQQEKNAAILKQEQDISENGDYHFGYETENGIRAEESGNPSQAQGGFSYKGDDGHTYTITYTSGEGGFRPQGEHIPVPPPTPQEILEALKQNERDEAAGIFDDGQYKPDVHGGPGNTGSGGSHGGSGSFGNNGNQGSGGNQQFGGNHQSGFNPNTGYTY